MTENEKLEGLSTDQLIKRFIEEMISLRCSVNTQSTVTISKLEEMDKKFSDAFPNGDTGGHRRYHEGVIEWQELRNKLVREALIKIAQTGGVAAFGWFLYAVWVAFKAQVMK
jgi:hypothetical protein